MHLYHILVIFFHSSLTLASSSISGSDQGFSISLPKHKYPVEGGALPKNKYEPELREYINIYIQTHGPQADLQAVLSSRGGGTSLPPYQMYRCPRKAQERMCGEGKEEEMEEKEDKEATCHNFLKCEIERTRCGETQ